MGEPAKRRPTLAMKRTAAQKRDRPPYGAKREMILKAAGPVLKKYGLGGTTIEAIAKEAGVDRATIYYYFEDKSAIFREAIHGGLVEMIDQLEEIAISGDSPDVRLRNSMRVVMRAFEKHYPQLYIFFGDGGAASIIDNELNRETIASGRRYEDLVDATVRDGIRQGVFQTSLPPKVFAKAVTGMLNWTSHWFVPGGAMSADDVADGMADTILGGVLVAQAKKPAQRRAVARR
jgi:AcrR family transcriptional regulator